MARMDAYGPCPFLAPGQEIHGGGEMRQCSGQVTYEGSPKRSCSCCPDCREKCRQDAIGEIHAMAERLGIDLAAKITEDMSMPTRQIKVEYITIKGVITID